LRKLLRYLIRFIFQKTSADNIKPLPVDFIDFTKPVADAHLSKTHGAMIRFSSTEDEDFQKIATCLVAMVAGAKGM